MQSIAYSPDGCHIISGSADKSIRIWDAGTGAGVNNPIEGHTDWVRCVAYSPDGRHIISGCDDSTIRIWDADTGTTIEKPLEGHSEAVLSVAYSPNGRYIISASADRTIRIWDATTGDAVGNPLKGHAHTVRSITCSPDGRHVVSGSLDNTIHVWDLFPDPLIRQASSYDPIHADFCAQPDAQGWVRDSNNGLLYWVPPDCCTGLHSPALLTIPPTSHTRSILLDFSDFVFGTSWAQIFNNAKR